MATWDQYIYGDGEGVFVDQMTTRPHELQVVGSTFLVWSDTGRPSYFDAYGSDLSSSGDPAQLNNGGIVTSFSYHVYNSYPAVSISGVRLTTADFKANILANGSGASGSAATFRAFMNSQSWTFNGSPGGDTFSSGDKSDKLFGYSGNDVLHGLGGNDTLDGGSGKDQLDGGKGDDTYYVDTDSDQVREAAGAGYDKVFATASFTLQATLAEVEYLATRDEAGTQAIRLTGSDQANTIRGNAGSNVINGRAGADTMIGLGGNDILYIDNALDKAVEAAGSAGGIDTVRASVTYALATGAAVEKLETTRATGTGALNLFGNEFGQTITGNDGANQLVGNAGNDVISARGGADGLQGGLGNDTLAGNGGNDGFYFSTALNAATNVDRILDFGQASGNADLIRLDNAIFATLGAAGFLDPDFFEANATGAATQPDDHVIYETDTGKLFYDTNGSTTGGATQFATLTNFASLTGANALAAADFYVY